MKKTCVLLVFACLPGLYFAQQGQQKYVSTQSNGVIVHETAGVEGIVSPASQNQRREQQVRTVSEWTLAECIDALLVIDEKMIYLTDSPEDVQLYAQYTEQKRTVTERRDHLMQSAR